MLHTIQHIEVVGDHRLSLTYDDGVTGEVDFGSIIQRGGVFSALDDPEFFRRVEISDDGRYIVWPGELDFCADALRVHEPVASSSG